MKSMQLFRFLAITLLFSVGFLGQNIYAGGDSHGEDKELDVGEMIMHHITDAHEWHLLGDFSIPLPCIVLHPEKGFDVFLSNKFEHGHKSYNGYVLDHGVLKSVESPDFPKQGSVDVHMLSEGQLSHGGKKL